MYVKQQKLVIELGALIWCSCICWVFATCSVVRTQFLQITVFALQRVTCVAFKPIALCTSSRFLVINQKPSFHQANYFLVIINNKTKSGTYRTILLPVKGTCRRLLVNNWDDTLGERTSWGHLHTNKSKTTLMNFGGRKSFFFFLSFWHEIYLLASFSLVNSRTNV